MDRCLYHVLTFTLVTRIRSYMVSKRGHASKRLHKVEVRDALQYPFIMAFNVVAQETPLLSQRSTHLSRIGASMAVDQFRTSGHHAGTLRLPLGEGATILERSGSFLPESSCTLHDTKRAAIYTEKSRHAFAHQHALHVVIICSLQHCVRVGAVGPLAFAAEVAPRPIPPQAICRSLYQGSLDVDLATATLVPRIPRVHPRIVYACQLGIRRITV